MYYIYYIYLYIRIPYISAVRSRQAFAPWWHRDELPHPLPSNTQTLLTRYPPTPLQYGRVKPLRSTGTGTELG